jgi:hypothetical protein
MNSMFFVMHIIILEFFLKCLLVFCHIFRVCPSTLLNDWKICTGQVIAEFIL